MSLKKNAAFLRKNMTPAEHTLWRELRGRQILGYKFRKQVPIERYIADFVCFEKRLIIEINGGQHAEAVEYDEKRTGWLQEQGYRVIRFWNNEVFENMGGGAGANRILFGEV